MVYLLALASAVLYGAADFLGGLASKRTSTLVVAFVSQAAGMLLLAAMLPWLPGGPPTRPDVLWGALAGLGGGIGVGLLYRGLAVGTMAVVAPTTALFAALIPVAVAFALGERPAAGAVLGMLLAAVAIVLASRPSNSETPTEDARRGLGLAVASGVAIGVFFLALARTGTNAGLWPLLAARVVSAGLFGGAIALRRVPLSLGGATSAILAAGAVDMLANALYLLASRSGQLSLVVVLASLYPASTVVLARVVLGERLSIWQTAGVVSALGALVLIVGFG